MLCCHVVVVVAAVASAGAGHGLDPVCGGPFLLLHVLILQSILKLIHLHCPY